MSVLDPQNLRANPGDILINAEACFPDLERLTKHFDVVIFLDFCVGLESAVLHNHLHCLGGVGPANPVLGTLVDAGVAEFYSGFIGNRDATIEASKYVQSHARLQELSRQGLRIGFDVEAIRAITERPKPMLQDGGDIFAFRNEMQAHMTETIRLLAELQQEGGPHLVPAPERWEAMAIASNALNMMSLEQVTSVPIAHPAHAVPRVLAKSSISNEDAVKRIIDQAVADTVINRTYGELKQWLFERMSMAATNAKREVLPMPPIAFDILGRVRNLGAVGYSLLEVREEYGKLREQFIEWDRVLRSDVAPAELARIELRLKKHWAELVAPKHVGWVEVCTAVGGLATIIEKLQKPVVDFSTLDWIGLAGAILVSAPVAEQVIAMSRSRFYLRPLLATRDVFDYASRTQLQEVVLRHFGHDLTDDELRVARLYLSSIRRHN